MAALPAVELATVLAGAEGFNEGNINNTYRGQVLRADGTTANAILKDVIAKELANELIAFVLARVLSLPVPDSLLAQADANVLPASKGPVTRDGHQLMLASVDVKVPNIQFRYRTDEPGRARLLGAITAWPSLGRLYGFDAWIANVDRHPGNLLFGAGAEAWLIDHGWAFTGPEWSPTDLDPAATYRHRLGEWLTLHLTEDGRITRARQAGVLEADLSLIDIDAAIVASRADILLTPGEVEAVRTFLKRSDAPGQRGPRYSGADVMVVNLDSETFPSFDHSIRARWAPIFLSPIRGSQERLVIGVVVFNDASFHIEAANALGRLQCLYGSQSDIIIQVAGIALDELKADLATRASEAIIDFRPSITGVTVGEARAAEGASLSAIGASWMGALSSLYDIEARDLGLEADDPDDSYESRFEAFAGGDRLPRLVLDYVTAERVGLAAFFRVDLNSKHRRRRSHEVSIDFTGSRLVANFGTLRVGQIVRSVDLIKRRLWDLKVDRDTETSVAFHRDHEMLIQIPSQNDPQVSENQFESLNAACHALEEQADQEQLRLAAFTSVAAIGDRVLAAEQSPLK